MTLELTYYRGAGHRQDPPPELPAVDPVAMRRPEAYLASRELAAAVNVALTLGMPLLLTGEPGCGKSRLANSVAWELGLGSPLEFVVKSDTESRDLFYGFDTLGRFHAAQSRQSEASLDPRNYITFHALGLAILRAQPEDEVRELLGVAVDGIGHPGAPRRSVVLVDEIDKAPRDVPNDLLTEIEELRFRIPELDVGLGRRIEVSMASGRRSEEMDRLRPIIIITSNSEKSLPEPFLRRCVYFHVEFPPFRAELDGEEGQVSVEAIVESRLGHRFRGSEPLVRDALALFRSIRSSQGLARRPSLSELLGWLDYVLYWRAQRNMADPARGVGKRLLDLPDGFVEHSVKTVLLKSPSDQGRAGTMLERFRQSLSG